MRIIYNSHTLLFFVLPSIMGAYCQYNDASASPLLSNSKVAANLPQAGASTEDYIPNS